MSDWNPNLYRQFEDERTRPARELLARVPLTATRRVYDLGCGPGNSTELLVERFPGAEVIGTDNSPAMLADAQKRLPRQNFQLSDIAGWAPQGQAPDVVYANASLQWLGDHATLIPRLFATLAPGGVLAVQMPDNLAEPSHKLMREVAGAAPWAATIGGAGAVRSQLLEAGQYYDLLARDAAQVDVWHTVYRHPMASAHAIVQWLRSTGLRPFLDPLDASRQQSFLAEYERRIDAAYPARADGQRLLAFPRLFIVAQRKS
ncbi:MAG TPA: trans-aconitate 2-methyltransferase [Ideonella sp.]|uniref:trans-aconitate 2-methyltransferase n=1 Tax=Ideonella sp. TaxID=1929293 RepID=UPI002E377E83|nr:trans-aconitate 2-methyltransferase [Ideonella sp.]HEX5687365.1 trans-aconitate 2-methyltransferase [Ideonella sp.]